jgi:hypothetical protein
MSMRRIIMLSFLAAVAAAQSAEIAGAPGKFRYALKLEQDREYSIRQTIENKMTWTAEGSEQQSKQKSGFGYTAVVTELDADGIAWARFTYDWISLAIDAPDQQVNYDSDNKNVPVPRGAEPYAAILGQVFYARITPEGRIERINGLDAMLGHVRGKLPPGEAREAASRDLKQQFNEQTIKALLENSMAVYPPEAVAVGDTWQTTDTIAGAVPLIFETSYELKDRKDGSATIEGQTTIKSDPRYDRRNVRGLTIGHKVTGSQQKTATLKESTGEILESRIDRDTVELFEMLGGSPRPQGLPESIARTTTITFRMTGRQAAAEK